MSWKEILKASLDAKGNTYSETQWVDNFLGPAMVLAEKRGIPLYGIKATSTFGDEIDGFIFDEMDDMTNVITIQPTDKKTLLEGVSLYKKIQEIDFTDRLEDQDRNTFQMLVDNFFRGKEVSPNRIYDYLDNALGVMTYGDVSMEEDPQKLKEQMQEILEELSYMEDFPWSV